MTRTYVPRARYEQCRDATERLLARATWRDVQVLIPHPEYDIEQTGHARRDLARAARVEALRVLRDDTIARARRAEHVATYPDAYYRVDEPCEHVPSEGRALLIPEPANGTRGTRGTTPAMVQAWDLERAADAFLRANGEDVPPRTDVWDRSKRVLTVTPDRLALANVPRVPADKQRGYRVVQRPKQTDRLDAFVPCRLTEGPDAVRTFAVDARGTCEHVHCHTVTRLVTEAGSRRFIGATGWTGRTEPIVPKQARRAATKRARATAVTTERVGTRGPARSPWALSARSLPRAVARVAATDPTLTDRIAAASTALHAVPVMSPVTVAGRVLLIDGTGQVTELDTHGNPRRMPTESVRSWACRIALAGATV